jgi:hypothetical protein
MNPTAGHSGALSSMGLWDVSSHVPMLLRMFLLLLQLPDCTPLPPPLVLRTVPPPTVLASPRRAAAPARLDLAAEAQRRQQQSHSHVHAALQQQQAQRRPRVGEARPPINITAVYPTVLPALPGSPSAMQREQAAQQQHWANVPGGMPGKGLVRGPCTRI